MEKDDILTMIVFAIFISIFIIYKICVKKIGEKRFFQLLYLITFPIALIMAFGNIGSLFSSSIGTIIIVLLTLLGGIILWIYDLKIQLDELK